MAHLKTMQMSISEWMDNQIVAYSECDILLRDIMIQCEWLSKCYSSKSKAGIKKACSFYLKVCFYLFAL